MKQGTEQLRSQTISKHAGRFSRERELESTGSRIFISAFLLSTDGADLGLSWSRHRGWSTFKIIAVGDLGKAVRLDWPVIARRKWTDGAWRVLDIYPADASVVARILRNQACNHPTSTESLIASHKGCRRACGSYRARRMSGNSKKATEKSKDGLDAAPLEALDPDRQRCQGREDDDGLQAHLFAFVQLRLGSPAQEGYCWR